MKVIGLRHVLCNTKHGVLIYRTMDPEADSHIQAFSCQSANSCNIDIDVGAGEDGHSADCCLIFLDLFAVDCHGLAVTFIELLHFSILGIHIIDFHGYQCAACWDILSFFNVTYEQITPIKRRYLIKHLLSEVDLFPKEEQKVPKRVIEPATYLLFIEQDCLATGSIRRDRGAAGTGDKQRITRQDAKGASGNVAGRSFL